MGHDVAAAALIDEALKKSALVWLDAAAPARQQAVWHVWVNGRIYFVTGAEEQPDPALAESESVTVIARSKDTGERLVALTATATRLQADHEDWDAAVTALVAARLNLREAETAPHRWATESYRLYRLTPSNELVEAPGHYSSESHAAPPPPTRATTKGPLPRVLHRRGSRGRPLS